MSVWRHDTFEIIFYKLFVHPSLCGRSAPLYMIYSDVWYRSTVSVTPGWNASPLLPKASKPPHISHITSLKSYILLPVLCDLTQWLFMPRDPAHVCLFACTRVFKVRSSPGLCSTITGPSLSSLHTSAFLPFLQFSFFQHFRSDRDVLTPLIHQYTLLLTGNTQVLKFSFFLELEEALGTAQVCL